jgi:tRNA(Ile)-lysidine synthase
MHMGFWSRLARSVADSDLIAVGDRILVAVSGGPDSVALLRMLCELREELQLHLELAHLQHGIRGAEAHADALFVSELARNFNLPFHLKEVSLPEIRAAAGKGNVEALARNERQRFFVEVMRSRGLSKLALAHTRDDQTETVMMWLLRGSGMTGLGGMAPLRQMKWAGHEITVVRPLLGCAKEELLAYLSELGQNFCIDRSNRDAALLRNWIRLELLPKIRERVDGKLSTRLAQQAEIMRDEDALLNALARRKLADIASAAGLNRSVFVSEPLAMQRRLLRLWIETTCGSLRGFDFDHIDDMLRLIEKGPPNGRLSIPGGWQVARQYDTVKLIKRERRPKRLCYEYRFTPGEPLSIAEAGCEIRSELIELPLERFPTDPREAVFDVTSLAEVLTVRNFRSGDYFQPLGMAGHKKIKDLFMERKLPLKERARLPLLAHGAEVLWIPGYGRSERAKVTLETALVLRVKVIDMNS